MYAGGGGGGNFCLFVEKQFFLISRFILFSTYTIILFSKKNIEKCPFTYWLNGRWFNTPNSREGTVGIYIHYILYSLVLILYLKCGGGLGGGGCNVFSHFMLFPTFLEKLVWEYKTIISHLMFSSCFFLYAGNIEKCPFTYSYWLNGRWFPPNSRYREFYHEIGNSEKCPFTYWLNGVGGFSQIVDIHAGNFNMKLTGR